MPTIKKMSAFVDESTFYSFLKEAQIEGLATDKGYVDINVVLGSLIKAYGEGRVVIRRDAKKREHAERFNPYTNAYPTGKQEDNGVFKEGTVVRTPVVDGGKA